MNERFQASKAFSILLLVDFQEHKLEEDVFNELQQILVHFTQRRLLALVDRKPSIFFCLNSKFYLKAIHIQKLLRQRLLGSRKYGREIY